MNRFRNKKKAAKEANEAAGRASNDSEVPAVPILKNSKTFKRGKKNEPAVQEPKVELDLSSALPSSDDFRTSLLMSGLSARFSMLREQDDPKSKLGKASDDSVLLPKRQSRLDQFTNFTPQGLSDIAEVNSIRSSNHFFRPPFATVGNTNSFHSTDGYGTDEDSTNGNSIMARAKPGEGNNLFGGRQKVYHIPVRAAGDSPPRTGFGMRGRARYDDDLSQSAFQRFKERERQQRENEEEQVKFEEDATQNMRSSSPPLSGYNRNRETSSTTSSGLINTRTSTAATSINSQSASPNVSNTYAAPSSTSAAAASGLERTAPTTSGLDRNVTKTRRLYETGLEKNLHEQQHSAMNRIDSLTRQHAMRSQTPPLTLSSPTSVPNLSERFERHELLSKPSQASLRAVSPPPSASILGKFEFGARPPASPSVPLSPFGEPPLSPPMSEGDDALSASLDARDRGKATALGAFNKPAQPYDDLKYSERQMQMKAGRETPQKPRPFQPVAMNQARSRAESNATTNSARSRSTSSAQRQIFVPRNRIPELRSTESKPVIQSPPPQITTFGVSGRSPKSAHDNRAFNRHVTDTLIAEEKPTSIEVSGERPPESQHPANRSAPRLWADFTHEESETDLPNPSILLSKADAPNHSLKSPSDSPTLGPTTGLSGMVRQHMRSDSNASSFFGAPSPRLGSQYPQDPTDPWDLEDWNRDKIDEQPAEVRKMKGTNLFSAVPQPLSIKVTKVEPLILEDESARPLPLSLRSPNVESFKVDERSKPAFEQDAGVHHKREGSTATQKETQNFANELAQRRRRVQENLKSFAESDSRSNSPVPDLDLTKEISKMRSNPLGILKAKSSRESLVNMQVRSRRMLGLGNTTISSSQSPKQPFDDDMWQKEEEEMLRGLSSKGPNASSPRRADFRTEGPKVSERTWISESDNERSEPEAVNLTRQHIISEEDELSTEPQNELSQNDKRETEDRVARKPSQDSKNSAVSSGQSRSSSRAPRDRSSSSTSGRSKSRNGMYRDDLAKAMAEGIGSSTRANYEAGSPPRLPAWPPHTPHPPHTPNIPSQPTVPSPMNGPADRSRSNSRPPPPKPATSYFDNHSLHPLQTGDNISHIGLSPRPSPVTPFSVNSTPSLTPNVSGANTPITQAQSFSSQNRALARKKTINKADISEPTLVSTTSQIDTVNLPPGASLRNGIEVPPVPPINPRRRQTRIQTMVGVFSSKSSEAVPTMPSHSTHPSPVEDQSTFSADESEVKKPRKLRKSSSEGGNLHSRARQLAQPSPAMPSKELGGMF